MSILTKNTVQNYDAEGASYFPGYATSTSGDAAISATHASGIERVIGWSGYRNLGGWASYRAGALLNDTNTLHTITNSSLSASLGSLSPGDVVKVALESGVFKLYLNDGLVTTFNSIVNMVAGVRVYPAVNMFTASSTVTPVLTGNLIDDVADSGPTAGDVKVEFNRYIGQQGSLIERYSDGQFTNGGAVSEWATRGGLLDMLSSALTGDAWVEWHAVGGH